MSKYPRVVGERWILRMVQVDEDRFCCEVALHVDAMGVKSDWCRVPPAVIADAPAAWLADEQAGKADSGPDAALVATAP